MVTVSRTKPTPPPTEDIILRMDVETARHVKAACELVINTVIGFREILNPVKKKLFLDGKVAVADSHDATRLRDGYRVVPLK